MALNQTRNRFFRISWQIQFNLLYLIAFLSILKSGSWVEDSTLPPLEFGNGSDVRKRDRQVEIRMSPVFPQQSQQDSKDTDLWCGCNGSLLPMHGNLALQTVMAAPGTHTSCLAGTEEQHRLQYSAGEGDVGKQISQRGTREGQRQAPSVSPKLTHLLL